MEIDEIIKQIRISESIDLTKRNIRMVLKKHFKEKYRECVKSLKGLSEEHKIKRLEIFTFNEVYEYGLMESAILKKVANK